jgi:hypothetical protein
MRKKTETMTTHEKDDMCVRCGGNDKTVGFCDGENLGGSSLSNGCIGGGGGGEQKRHG